MRAPVQREAHGAVMAIVLARAGSKGLPGKNVMELGGRPCIAWTIDQALAARTIDLVAVSSDDHAALSIADAMGVHAVQRPAALASDTARVDDAARHAVEELESDPASPLRRGRAGGRAGVVVILYANVPVRPAGLIDRAVELLREQGGHSVQSYQPVGKHHPWWTARVDPASGAVTPWEGQVLNHGVFRRQDLPAAHVPDGAVLACTRSALFCEVGAPAGPHAFFGVDRRGIITPEGSVVDIDSRVDALVADALLRAR